MKQTIIILLQYVFPVYTFVNDKMSKGNVIFRKIDNGLVINTKPPKDFKHKGNIDRRNEADEKFYTTRMKILERDMQPILQKIVNSTSPNANSSTLKILDVGCGDGLLLNSLNKLRGSLQVPIALFGLDLDEKALKKIKHKAVLKVGSATNIPFKDSSFGLVTTKDVIEHLTVKEINLKFKEVFRVLKIGGIFYCETPNPDSMIARIMGEEWWMYKVPDHLTLIPPEAMKKLVNRVGFSKYKTYTRAEIDEQFDEVSEILSRIPDSILNKQFKRIRHRTMRYLLKYLNRGSITCTVAKK